LWKMAPPAGQGAATGSSPSHSGYWSKSAPKFSPIGVSSKLALRFDPGRYHRQPFSIVASSSAIQIEIASAESNDQNGSSRCHAPDEPLPGLLGELAGVDLVDIASMLAEGEARFAGVDTIPGGAFRGWSEQIEPTTARVLALYEEGDFAETAAVTVNDVRSGRVFYIAGAAIAETLKRLYATIASGAGLATSELPDGTEAVTLERNGETLLVLLNHRDEERFVALDGRRRDLVSGADQEREVRLGPFGVAVLAPVPAAVETA